MYLLEHAHVVQFFLFDATTLDFDRTTAIIAPNGAGKSAILDALQIVMLGADGSQLHFNAQAGGKHRARSIRDYCLGVFREGDDGRARDTATTYLSLVFRDADTGQALTAGIALGASLREPDHRVHGWYLLPDVALTLDQHLETVGGHQLPLSWADFKAMGNKACKQAGSALVLPAAPGRFVDDLLKRLRPGTSYADPVAYRKSFQNALNLQRVDDVDLFVRTRIAEDRPTDIAKFRNLLEGFRQIKQTIDQVVERIGTAEEVEHAYKAVARHAVRAASYRALSATYLVERHGEEEYEAEQEVDAAREAAETCQREIQRLTSERNSARQDLEAASQRLQQVPGYGQQAAWGAALRQSEASVTNTARQLDGEIKRIQGALAGVGRVAALEAHHPQLEQALSPWLELQSTLQARAADAALARSPETLRGTLRDSLSTLAPLHQAVTSQLQSLRNQLGEAQQAERTARNNQQRASAGKAELHPDVSRLRDYLADAGIEATPVCDLVRIVDADWQPAIEAYLRRHVEALLIAPDQEEDAMRVYRNLRGPQAVYGVKLALSSQARRARTSSAKDSVAVLVDGDNADAVDYLRMQLGELKRVSTEKDAIAARSALTQDGFLTKGGGIERRRLPGSDELKIGAAESRDRRQRIDRELQRHGTDARRLKQELDALEQHTTAFSALRQADAVADRIHALALQLEEASADLRRQKQEHDADASPDLMQLSQRRDECDARVNTLEAAIGKANQAIGAAALRQQSADKTLANVQARANLIHEEARQASRHPDADPHVMDEARQELDDAHEALEDRIAQCEKRAQTARDRLTSALPQAWAGLTSYAAHYHLRLELTSEQWRESAALIDGELKRLRDTELVEHQARAEEAYSIAVNTFRTNVASTLYDNFTRLKQQINALNATLRRSPVFSNNERYQFRHEIVPELKDLHAFILKVGDVGSEDTLFGSVGELPAVFRDIIDGGAESRGRTGPSPLDDYRLFYRFEVIIKQDDREVGTLSKRMKSGSGGEHRAPLYVIAGASLASAYGKKATDASGLGVILLDEFGDKIDAQNARAITDYLRSLGLQLVLAAPDTAQGTLTGVLDSYIELFRDGVFLHVNRVDVSARGRELLESDQFTLHPELLDAEIERIKAAEGAQ
ncbi:MAG: SbcC/MukB-like Walker B domain-containing protein [Pseudoxanthomonas sp.]